MALRAIIFDVDGTLAETEEHHRIAFNTAFREAGLDWVWDRELYRDLLDVTGGRERIEEYARRMDAGDVSSRELHRRKTEIYCDRLVSGEVELRPGVAALIANALDAGIRLAIATTTSRPNVEALFEATLGSDVLRRFDAVCTGEDVSRKKPDPEVFEICLKRLRLTAADCVVLEDSENGLVAAKALGLPVLLTPSMYSGGQDFSGADLVVKNLESPYSLREHMPSAGWDDVPRELWKLLSVNPAAAGIGR